MIRVEMSKRDWRIQPPYLYEPYASTVRRASDASSRVSSMLR